VEQSFYYHSFAFGWNKVFTIIALLLGGTKFLLTIDFVFKNKIKRINDIKKLAL